jgi:hypothetical protein
MQLFSNFRGNKQNDVKRHYTNNCRIELTGLQPYDCVSPTTQLLFLLDQHMMTLCKLMVLASIGELVLLYIPKISHHILHFLSEMVILGILWDRNKDCD